MKHFIRNRISIMNRNVESDDGSSTLTFWLIMMPVLLVMLSSSIDLSKNRYLAEVYERGADSAARAASNVRDAYGRLTGESVKRFDSEYKIHRSELHSSTAGFRNNYCDAYEGGTYPMMRAGISEGRGGTLNLQDGAQPANFVASISWSGNASPGDLATPNTRGLGYSMVANVRETSGNFMLGMFGQPCQVYNIDVGTVSISEDGDYVGR